VKTWWLQSFIFIRRQGTGTWLLFSIWLVTIGLALNLLILRETGHRNAKEIASLQQDNQELLATRQSANTFSDDALTGARQFQSILGKASALQGYLKTVFQIAAKKDLTFPVGSYKANYNVAGGYESHILELPITGTYQNIRELSEEILLALPFSALEEMKFKRDSSNNAMLEVRLRFILFLQPDGLRPGTPPTGVVGR
jgi:hypothetical protein